MCLRETHLSPQILSITEANFSFLINNYLVLDGDHYLALDGEDHVFMLIVYYTEMLVVEHVHF